MEDLDMFLSTSIEKTVIYFMTIHNGLIYSISYQATPLQSMLPGNLPFLDSTLTGSTSNAEHDNLSQHLPIVQKMANSFELTNLKENNGVKPEILPEQTVGEKCKEYVEILKSRLVKGEITQEEFVEHKKLIEC
jgi:hypothetical protein